MNDSDVTRFLPLGKHLYRVDGDTLYMVSNGILTLEEMTELLDRFAEILREHGMCFVFYDSRRSGGMESSARKLAADSVARHLNPTLQVGFGASFVVRVLIDMLIKAQKLLNREVVALHMFSTETEARTFFEAERARLRSEHQSKAN